jgi:hypothetical protein
MLKHPDDSFLGINVIEILITSVWNYTYPKILLYVFMPYMIYFGCFILYISFVFDPMVDNVSKYIILPICLLYACMQLAFEGK